MNDTDRARAEGVIEGLEMAADRCNGLVIAHPRDAHDHGWTSAANEAYDELKRLAAARREELAKGKGGIAAVFGKWPGDESDEEIERLAKGGE